MLSQGQAVLVDPKRSRLYGGNTEFSLLQSMARMGAGAYTRYAQELGFEC